jgi:alcohol dehydrogenase class IV
MRGNTLTGPGSSAAIPFVARSFCGDESRYLRTAIVVSGGFDTRPWSASIRQAVNCLSPQWLTQHGTLRPDGVAVLARQLRECDADIVIAVGGGSVLDAAKAAMRLSDVADVDAATVIAACTGDFQPPSSRMRLIAVPTTPGTGAEVTPFATVWHPERNRKLSLSGADLVPAGVILDPDLLQSLSAGQLCVSLLDTMCQGAEAAWSVRATHESTSYGLAAVSLVGFMLDRLDPQQPGEAARLTLQLAGNLSGHAIARAPTSSCHALSYPLTLHAGLAHGHACGVTFGRMLRYNADVDEADCADPRGCTRVRHVVDRIVAALGAADPADAEKRVEEFLRRNGLATFDEVPCPPELVAREALTYSRIADNPRALSFTSLISQLSER